MRGSVLDLERRVHAQDTEEPGQRVSSSRPHVDRGATTLQLGGVGGGLPLQAVPSGRASGPVNPESWRLAADQLASSAQQSYSRHRPKT